MSSYHEPAVIQPTNTPSNTPASAATLTADITMRSSDDHISISSAASSPNASDALLPDLRRQSQHLQQIRIDDNDHEDEAPELDLYRIKRDHELGETPSPLSPRTTSNTLEAYDNIDAFLLRQICKGLLETIKQREDTRRVTEARLNNQINGLGKQVMDYQSTFDCPPDGYVENVHFHQLAVPIGHGLSRPVKWVKQLESGSVSCYTSMDGPHDSPHIFPIYASPVVSAEDPAEPLPRWLRGILHGPAPMFHNVVEAARTLDDWGVAADLLRYRTLDDEVQGIELQISRLERDRASADHARIICEARLEASRCAESLAYLEGLAPKPARIPMPIPTHDDIDDQVAKPRCKHLRRGRY